MFINRFLPLLFLLLSWATLAAAVTGKLHIDVIRADNDAPIEGAIVSVQDRANARPPLSGKTDAQGVIHFDDLPLGEYYVEVTAHDYGNDRALVKVTADAEAVYKAMLDTGNEMVIRAKEDRLLVNGHDPADGSVTRRDRSFMDRSLAESSSLQGLLTTIPGTERDAVGQTHVRGEHHSVTFSLDGVTVPIPLSANTLQPLDTDFLDELEAQTGSYDASAGGQLGLTLNAITPNTSKPFATLRPRFGTQGTYDVLFKTGGSNDDGSFNYYVGARTGGTDLNLEGPNPDQQTLGNRSRANSLLVRLNGKTDEDQIGFSFSYQNNSFGIPQTPQNFGAGVVETELDSNVLGLFSFKHKLNDDSDLLMGLSVLKSTQNVDSNGIFTPFTVFPADVSADLNASLLPADPQNYGNPYTGFTRLAITQVQPTLKYSLDLGERQKISAGVQADFIHSHQQVDLRDLGGGGGLPDPFTGMAGAPFLQANLTRQAFFGGAFFSHTLPISDDLTLNYGLRADIFDNGAPGVSHVHASQISPVVNLAYSITPTQVLRASYNRVFQPPPLELDVSGQSFVLPQRISAYELSYENQIDKNIVGKVALVRKDYRDQVDVGQLIPNSTFPLYGPVNFGSAYYQGLELSLNTHNPTGWNGFLAGTYSVAKPLSPGPFDTEVPQYNDHDQRVQTTFGVSYTWENGFSAAADCYYGSGYPQTALTSYNAVGIDPFGYQGDRVPRFLTNLNFQYMPPPKDDGHLDVGCGLQVLNLFDQRTLQNFFSAFSGTRFVQQRRLLLNATLRW